MRTVRSKDLGGKLRGLPHDGASKSGAFQEAIFARAGFAVPRSTLAQRVGSCRVRLQPMVDALRDVLLMHAVLHADETPVAMLKPGKGSMHKAYLGSYCTTSFDPVKAVVFDFAETRAGQNAREFLRTADGSQARRGTLVCDDYSGYKAMSSKASSRPATLRTRDASSRNFEIRTRARRRAGAEILRSTLRGGTRTRILAVGDCGGSCARRPGQPIAEVDFAGGWKQLSSRRDRPPQTLAAFAKPARIRSSSPEVGRLSRSLERLSMPIAPKSHAPPRSSSLCAPFAFDWDNAGRPVTFCGGTFCVALGWRRSKSVALAMCVPGISCYLVRLRL
jgi:hypothetical protein